LIQPDSLHLVDPELMDVLEARRGFVVNAETLPFVRQAFALSYQASPEAFVGVEMTRRSAPGWVGDPNVGLAVYRPKNGAASLPCILHLHGGGYVVGDPWSHEAVHRAMALELGCVIVSVDYRLAPETKFPGAVHDSYAALAWLWAQAEELGVDSARVGVSGESAGGGLAAGLALLVRDRAEFSLSFQHLTYPMIDDRTCTDPDQNPYTGEFIWTRESNRFGWASLLGEEPGGAVVSPYAAAARATDLSGLPPTFIATGALDLFIDEDIDYARRLIRAGVQTEFHIYPGAYHGFTFEQSAAVTITAQRDSLAALARALERPITSRVR
jgi:acetyl esterase/lipase